MKRFVIVYVGDEPWRLQVWTKFSDRYAQISVSILLVLQGAKIKHWPF